MMRIFGFLYLMYMLSFIIFFFFNDPATTEIYTLSLHDALPIYLFTRPEPLGNLMWLLLCAVAASADRPEPSAMARSEEHTSELQSRPHLVCRLLLEKKKK